MERESPSSPKHGPVVEQEAAPIFKEQFVPPDLSIWDYFIRKVIQHISDSGRSSSLLSCFNVLTF